MRDIHPELQAIAAAGHAVWGRRAGSPVVIATLATVVVGDLARAVRDHDRAGQVRELGNLMVSAPRWATELGMDLAECADAAIAAQREWADRRG
nr:hypothetical protein [Micromonospora sp. DSM 115978]